MGKHQTKFLKSDSGLVIAGPMHAECKAAVVVPVYDEPISMVLRCLASLSAQTGIKKECYEVLVNVNNSREEAEKISPAFLQNQKILAVLKVLLGQKTQIPFALTQSQKASLDKIRKSQMRIAAIDASSPEFAQELNNCGSAKNRGGREACRRFNLAKAGHNGIIAITDCDCRFSKNYLAEIIKTLRDPKVNLAAGLWLTEIDPALPHGQAMRQALAIHFGFDNNFKSFKHSKKPQALLYQKRDKIKQPLATNGQNIGVPVKAFLGAGGFPELSSFDDIIFGHHISKLAGDIVYNPNFWVCNLMRCSDRAGMASIGRRVKSVADSVERFTLGQSTTVEVPDLSKIHSLFRTVGISLRKNVLSAEGLRQHLVAHGVKLEQCDQGVVEELYFTLDSEFKTKDSNHGWQKTESLVLSKFYNNLPSRVFGNPF